MSYDNFKDPLGLAKRMLASGNKAAYFTLLREALGMILKPIDWLLMPWERKLLRQSPSQSHAKLLILGGSRSGTTLLYQVLAQYLPVSYFSNLNTIFHRSPIAAGKLFSPLLRRRKGDFQNYFGSVSGFSGPNDGFPIWNRWLGEDRNSLPTKIDQAKLEEMRLFFRAWSAAFPLPFLNKNNRNTLAIPFLEANLDHVQYLEIRRNPIFVVQSLILSRVAVQGSKYIGWGLKSTDSDRRGDPLRYIDDICEQVYEVEKSLDEAKLKIPTQRYLSVSYEDLCSKPKAVIQQVSDFLGIPHPNPDELKDLQPFQNTNIQRLDDQEWDRINSCLSKLYGVRLTQLFKSQTA